MKIEFGGAEFRAYVAKIGRGNKIARYCRVKAEIRSILH